MSTEFYLHFKPSWCGFYSRLFTLDHSHWCCCQDCRRCVPALVYAPVFTCLLSLAMPKCNTFIRVIISNRIHALTLIFLALSLSLSLSYTFHLFDFCCKHFRAQWKNARMSPSFVAPGISVSGDDACILIHISHLSLCSFSNPKL